MTTSTDPVFYVRAIQAKAYGGQTVDVSDRVTQLTYAEKLSTGTTQTGGADRLTLAVDNFDLQHFEKPVLRTGNRVEVSWGYPGRMSPPRTCTIIKVTGGLALTVEALGMSVLLHRHMEVRTWSYMKYSEIAAEIAAKHGYGPDLQHIDDTVDTEPQVTQARMTDAMLLREMCRRTGFAWYVDFDGFHFHPRRLGQKPCREFRYYTDMTGEVLSFNVENDIFARKAGGVTVTGRDPKTGKPIEAKADNASSKGTVLAPDRVVVTGVSARDGAATGDYVKESGSSTTTGGATSDAAARKQAAAMYSGNQLTAAQLTLTCRGDPSLCAKSIVRVTGIGKLIEGNYYVKEVTHTVGTGGYTMEVKCMRTGMNPTYGGGGVPAKGAQNAANAPAGKPGDPSRDAPLVVKPDPRDGSVSFVESRGRTNDATPAGDPSAPADPLGITTWNEDQQKDGVDPSAPADPLGITTGGGQ